MAGSVINTSHPWMALSHNSITYLVPGRGGWSRSHYNFWLLPNIIIHIIFRHSLVLYYKLKKCSTCCRRVIIRWNRTPFLTCLHGYYQMYNVLKVKSRSFVVIPSTLIQLLIYLFICRDQQSNSTQKDLFVFGKTNHYLWIIVIFIRKYAELVYRCIL